MDSKHSPASFNPVNQINVNITNPIMGNFTTAARQANGLSNINMTNNKRFSRCRYDYTIIQEANIGPFENVCSNQSCVNEYLGKCKTIFSCGHECNGLKVDSHKCDSAFKCLNSSCKDYNKIYNQNLQSLCPICLTDPLETFSLIQLPCQHYIHKTCYKKRLEIKWSTKEINFSNLKCPLCNKIPTKEEFTKDKEIFSLVEEGMSLYEKIVKIASEINSDSELDLDLDKYAFYICEKCQNPFYGGLRECREDDINILSNIEKKLCLECFDYSKIKGVTNCEMHGRKYIQYKCKFCCNISSHFCFGTTHFCEDCHIRQVKGEYLTNKEISELPKCEGEKSCPLKIDHPVNGEEYGLYCLLCLK